MAVWVAHGLFSGVLAPGAFAMLGDRDGGGARSMGVSGALIAVSAIAGPRAAGVISEWWGFTAAFTASGTLMLLAGAAFWMLAPQSSEPEIAQKEDEPPAARVIKNPALPFAHMATLAMVF